jgi:hypothetical protein
MDDSQGIFSDSWLAARLGNAIDAGIDRVTNRPQYNVDPGRSYGVDQNGNLYQLGQSNSQLTAQINTGKPAMGNGMLLILALGAVVLLLESK